MSFSSEYTINYKNTGADLTASLHGFMAYIQETSLLHSKSCGYPMEWFSENKKAFILTSWDISVLSYPQWNDKIYVETWPFYFKGITAGRSFTATDCLGNTLLMADSYWLYSDTEKRKPVKIEEDTAKAYGAIGKKLIETPFKLSDNTEGMTLLKTCEIKAARSAIDSNGHVNNISYMEWALDSMEDAIYNKFKVRDISIKYKKECVLNQVLTVEIYKDADTENIFTTIIRDTQDKDRIHCILKSRWA